MMAPSVAAATSGPYRGKERMEPAVYDILLVEDNAGDVRLVRECFALGRTPKQIHVVGDCENALAFLRKAGTYANAPSPHLILLDLRLPDGDGRTVLAALQADPRLHLIPVVVFSSCCSDVETSELYGLGANCCVAKPRDFDDYARAVRMIEECWLVQGNLPKGWRDA